MISRAGMARYYAEWLYAAVICTEKLEDAGELEHAKNLRSALDALAEIFSVDVGRKDLADAMRAVAAMLDEAAQPGSHDGPGAKPGTP